MNNVWCWFVDGSVLGSSGNAGIGGVLFDELRCRIHSFSRGVGVASPIAAEFLAVKEALAVSCSLLSVAGVHEKELVIFSDCLNLVNWFNFQQPIPSSFQDIIKRCQDDFKSFKWRIVHILREDNEEADNLAKLGVLSQFVV